MARKSSAPRPDPPIVLYAPLGELKVYELSEAEFERLASGPSDQLHLNFALAMLPTALSILITLQTTTIASDRVYVAYLVAFWMLLVQGVISLVRWWRSNRSHRQLIDRGYPGEDARPSGHRRADCAHGFGVPVGSASGIDARGPSSWSVGRMSRSTARALGEVPCRGRSGADWTDEAWIPSVGSAMGR